MRFTIEQQFLKAASRKQASPPVEYHLVEADTLDAALDAFLSEFSASLIGTVQKFPGLEAVATARTADAVFTVHLMPGSDRLPPRR